MAKSEDDYDYLFKVVLIGSFHPCFELMSFLKGTLASANPIYLQDSPETSLI